MHKLNGYENRKNTTYVGKRTPTVNLLLYILLNKLTGDKVSSWSALAR